MIIGFMPIIYPDELVYSWFCRYFVHSGYSANKMALADILYNRHCNPSKEFIGHLNPEMEQLIKEIDSMDRLILEHTMFPQYARYTNRGALSIHRPDFAGSGSSPVRALLWERSFFVGQAAAYLHRSAEPFPTGEA